MRSLFKGARDPKSRTRYPVLWVAATLAVVLTSGVACGTKRPSPVRRESGLSVLLITFDTLRADALGSYGNTHAQTPWMDRLAANGVLFANAHAHNVVTLPSHANILSGRYPFDHGVRDNSGFRFPPTIETLATILKARGYRTGAFVSAFPLDSRFGLNRGFDIYEDSFVEAEPQQPFFMTERSGTSTVALAQRWLASQGSHPSFCWVHLYEPHFPYRPAEPFSSRTSRPYDGEVSTADAAMRPLVEPILTAGNDARTLVVLTSDHGESLGEHGEATHGIFAYEASLRVPLIVYQPRLLQPGIVTTPARHIDVLPTVLDALSIALPAGLPGKSLLPAIAGSGASDEVTYFEALSSTFNRGTAPLFGVLKERSKYIQLPIPELYDVGADPHEAVNLASRHPERLRELDRLVTSFRAAARDAKRIDEDADTHARLKALGYVAGATSGKARYTEGDDPKRLVDLDNQLQEVTGLYLDGDLPRALERCRDLVRRRPSMTMALLYLAHLERESGHLDAGIEALRKAVAASPTDPQARALLGAYLTQGGRAADAIDALEPMATQPNADLQVVVSYALAQAKLGRHDTAANALAAARERDSSNAMLLVELGTVHLMANDRDAARKAFEGALAINENVARAHSSLGALDADAGRRDAAFAHWRRAVEIDRRELEKLLTLGILQQRANRSEAARPYLEFFAATASPSQYASQLEMVRQWLR
jgi:choline-sulfatase